MFIPTILGTQQNILTFLKREIEEFLTSSINTEGTVCYQNIRELICKYYMTPCEIHQLSLYSICPEDCSAIERDCPILWKTTKRLLEQFSFINCNHTFDLIFPLPNCCVDLSQETFGNGNDITYIHIYKFGRLNLAYHLLQRYLDLDLVRITQNQYFMSYAILACR